MRIFLCSLVLLVFGFARWGIQDEETQKPESTTAVRRPLRVALYPYIPALEGIYWKVEQEFEEKNPLIDLQYVSTGVNYYGGDIRKVLENKTADVAEVDTVLLEDLADDELLEDLSSLISLPKDEFFSYAVDAANVDGKCFGIPHWVCGNFLFFRADDPEAEKFRAIDSLDDLERILGRPLAESGALMVDLNGSSTLGEKYLDALLDELQSVDKALESIREIEIEETGKVKPETVKLNPSALRSLDRLFALTPGGLCDSSKHHEYGQFYARQFSERGCRALIGYSERMYYVVDHHLHGVREDEPSVGGLSYNDKYLAVGAKDVEVVPASLSNNQGKTLSWVDALVLRKDLEKQTQELSLIHI